MYRLPALLALAALVTLPLWLDSNYYVNIASQILIWAVFALALNVLVGWAGLVSLGHAGLFGVASYAAAWLVAAGWGHLAAALGAVLVTLGATAVFGLLSLRTSGIGFIMITLAIGQILWGVAYRWIALTNGDNGIIVDDRPLPLGMDLSTPAAFYTFTLVVFLLTYALMKAFAASPFGASLRGTRDQPRRMSSLGYHVWLIRFLAVLFSGLFSGIAGLLFVYYHQFVSPHALSLAGSAEVLLMVISGGTGTLLGPVVGAALVVIVKNVASAYIERWNLVLGAIFVAIVVFMPDGLVPGSVRLWGWLRARFSSAAVSDRGSEDDE
ncbi:MAG: branched-chain amino acid ABC transporter permease [Gammaproteobacteria bacterium]|nr:branched-chain amino acid ABC transporter permease [Gammaproteobacteria bacterium]